MKKIYLACIALLAAAAVGCDDDNDLAGQLHANTDEVYSGQYHSATVIANVYGDNITERGICWSEQEEFPRLDGNSQADEGTGAGEFTAYLTNLSAGTSYYVCSYAVNSSGKVSYGSSRQFTTVTYLNTSITGTTADLTTIQVNARISDGLESLEITERGVYYGTSANPAATGTKARASTTGKGDFEITLSGLDMDTRYYIVSYAVSEEGTIYSEAVTVSTLTPIPELFLTALQSAGLEYGIVRDASGQFVMHYTYDIDPSNATNCYITVTYIESTGDRDAVHVTEQVSFNSDYTEATWSTVSNDGNSFGGMNRNLTSFFVIGTSGLELDTPMPAEDIYGMYTHSNYGGINRVSNLTVGNHHGSVPTSLFDDAYCVEFNGESSALVIYPWSVGTWIFYYNTLQDGIPYMPITEDRIIFTFGGQTATPYGSATEAQIQEGWDMLDEVRNIFYDPDGLIILREARQTATIEEGDFMVYAISARNEGWLRFRLRKYGE